MPDLTTSIRMQERLLKAICLVQGITMLFPWNALISDNSQAKYVSGHKYKSQFRDVVVFTYLFSNMATMAVNTFVKFSAKKDRIITIAGFLVFLVTFLTLLVITLDPPSATNAFWLLTVLYGLVGIATGCVQVNIFALTAKVHFRYSTLVLLGQALAGIIPPLVGFIMALFSQDDKGNAAPSEAISSVDVTMAIVYYVIVLIVLSIGLIMYLPLPRVVQNIQLCEAMAPATSSAKTVVKEHNSSVIQTESSENKSSKTQVRAWSIFKALHPLPLVLFLIFSLTIMIFPGATESINPEITSTRGKKLFISSTYLVYGVADLLGRMFPSRAGWLCSMITWLFSGCPTSQRKSVSVSRNIRVRMLLLLSIARWGLAFCFFTFPYAMKREFWPTPFRGPILPLITIFFLGFSNGAIATDAFVLAPSSEIDCETETNGQKKKRPLTDAEMSLSGRFTTFSLLIGLVTGALLAFAYKKALLQCDSGKC